MRPAATHTVVCSPSATARLAALALGAPRPPPYP
jgi:hypothetical protein